MSLGLRAISLAIDVEDFALVTYRVAADRVRAQLPDVYELETYVDEGQQWAFVSTTCFCNRNLRPALTSWPRHTYSEMTHRTYIDFRGRPGVYFFSRYVSTTLSWVPQRVIDRGAVKADFDVAIQREADGYSRYEVSAVAGDEVTSFSLEALNDPPATPPWRSGREHEQFLTYRVHGCFTATPGFEAHGSVVHQPMPARSGTLLGGEFPLWRRLGFLDDADLAAPYSVLVTPGTRFLLQPPRPVRPGSRRV